MKNNPRPMKKEDLDKFKCHCGKDSCEGLVFATNCHPDIPPMVIYQKGILTFRCSQCDKLIAMVEVASSSIDLSTFGGTLQ